MYFNAVFQFVYDTVGHNKLNFVIQSEASSMSPSSSPVSDSERASDVVSVQCRHSADTDSPGTDPSSKINTSLRPHQRGPCLRKKHSIGNILFDKLIYLSIWVNFDFITLNVV